MSFMQLRIYQKGSLYSCECSKCGTTSYSHEWTADTLLNTADEWANARCNECGGTFDTDTFAYEGRQYAGRYSADGYMNCTDWNYSPNKRALARDLRAMYA